MEGVGVLMHARPRRFAGGEAIRATDRPSRCRESRRHPRHSVPAACSDSASGAQGPVSSRTPPSGVASALSCAMR